MSIVLIGACSGGEGEGVGDAGFDLDAGPACSDSATAVRDGGYCEPNEDLFGKWALSAGKIETDNVGNFDRQPHVKVDAAGNAIAVWRHDDGIRSHIMANRFVVGEGWGIAEFIETDNSGSAVKPQLAIDTDGNAMAVWQQWVGTGPSSAWSNRYNADVGWGTPELIEIDDSAQASGLQVGMDAQGNALAVWSQSNDIWINQHIVGVGWGTPEYVENDTLVKASNAKLAIDPTGSAHVVWSERRSNTLDILSSRYVPGEGWGSVELVETEANYSAYAPQLTIDGAGNTIAVWQQEDGFDVQSIWSNRYVMGVGWGTAELIASDRAIDRFTPQVGGDVAGNAIAVWYQYEGTTSTIWSSRYVVGAGWRPAELLQADISASSGQPQIAVNAAGSAVAVWLDFDGEKNNVKASQYLVGAGWGQPMAIKTQGFGGANNAEIGINAAGDAVAVWLQPGGQHSDIWSNHIE